jgi:CheY-like chemotaxis protein
MYDDRKGSQQLLEELNALRSKVAQLERSTEMPRPSDTQLKEGAELLKLLMENTSDLIMIADAEAKPIAFNRAYAKTMKTALNIEMKPGIQPHKLLANQAALNADRKFDLVILDATITGGAGGEQVIKELRALDPVVKGIISSGYSESPVFSEPYKYGFKGWISKPYLIDDLMRVIRAVMDPTE